MLKGMKNFIGVR